MAPDYSINQQAFNNPNYQGPQAYSNAIGGYLGAAGAPVTAATAAPTAQTNYNVGNAGQLALAGQYRQMAAGQGPSAATVAAGQQGAANLQSAESMLGSARGAGNPAAAELAARGAQATGANAVAQNAVAGKTQEELAALGAAGGLYGNVAGQGLSSAGLTQAGTQFNATQQNAIAQANQANTLASQTNYLNNVTNQGLAQQQGLMAGQQLGVNQQLGLGNIGVQAFDASANANQKIAGSVMSGVGGLAGALL
jgi:hypothetical protein